MKNCVIGLIIMAWVSGALAPCVRESPWTIVLLVPLLVSTIVLGANIYNYIDSMEKK